MATLAVPAVLDPRLDTSRSVRLPVPGVLRVVADPHNMPFSNNQGGGFEIAIAKLVARDLHCRLRYVWWAEQRGFVRDTLAAGAGDVVMGIPAGYGSADSTAPYYRSTYVFVTRADRGLALRGLDDPALAKLRIGVPLADGGNAIAPPARALAARGLTSNLTGFAVTGDSSRRHPPTALVAAVAHGDVDVAVAWGPLAGWCAKRSPVPLRVRPIPADSKLPHVPFAFDIAMGVRHGDTALRDSLDRILARRELEIRDILESYGVPLVDDVTP